MIKKYPAQRMIIFAVYKTFIVFGGLGRYLKVAFPDRIDAEKWVEDYCNTHKFETKESFMIEEMPATMKAWKIA